MTLKRKIICLVPLRVVKTISILSLKRQKFHKSLHKCILISVCVCINDEVEFFNRVLLLVFVTSEKVTGDVALTRQPEPTDRISVLSEAALEALAISSTYFWRLEDPSLYFIIPSCKHYTPNGTINGCEVVLEKCHALQPLTKVHWTNSTSLDWKVPRNQDSGHWCYISAPGCRQSTNCPCNFGLILTSSVGGIRCSGVSAGLRCPWSFLLVLRNQRNEMEAIPLF